jgi:hypothetical protein
MQLIANNWVRLVQAQMAPPKVSILVQSLCYVSLDCVWSKFINPYCFYLTMPLSTGRLIVIGKSFMDDSAH